MKLNNLSSLLTIQKNCIKKVSVMLPFSRQGLTSYLSPILGQYGIRNSDFISVATVSFNKLTNERFLSDFNTEDVESQGLLNYDFSTPILLTIYKGGKYDIQALLPQIGILYKNINKRRRFKRKKLKLYRRWRYFLILAQYNKMYKDLEYNTNRSLYMQVRNTLHRKR